MKIFQSKVGLNSITSLIMAGVILNACHKKSEAPVPDSKSIPPLTVKSIPADSAPLPVLDSVQDTENLESTPRIDSSQTRKGFLSTPRTSAQLGRLFEYKPVMSKTGVADKVDYTFKLLKGPDSMFLQNGLLRWTPKAPGNYPVILEAIGGGQGQNQTAKSYQQSFTLMVSKVLDLVLKPLPTPINKGDSMLFDLRPSKIPAWALSSVKTRFDFEGDGKWDTDWLMAPNNLAFTKSFERPGKYVSRIEVNYQDLEIQTLTAEFSVISPVNAYLKISPDTVEPGGILNVDASATKGDGRLKFELDLDGDGKLDWTDSNSTKVALKAPGSGKYQALLTATNSMGQVGRATLPIWVNAKPVLEMKVRNNKINMTTELEIRAQVTDADDSLASVRINFTGDSLGWVPRTNPPDSIINAKNWLLRFKHAYGKVGKYKVILCAAARDNREVCRQVAVEVYNAPPECLPGGDVHATLGIPMEIIGQGNDPDGKIVKWEWDLDGDGKYDLVSAQDGRFKYTFAKLGSFNLVLRVTTADGMQATGVRKVEVRKKWKT